MGGWVGRMMGWFGQAGEQSLLSEFSARFFSEFSPNFSPDLEVRSLGLYSVHFGWVRFGERAGRQASKKASVGIFSEFSPDPEVRSYGFNSTRFGYVTVRLGMVRSFENRLQGRGAGVGTGWVWRVGCQEVQRGKGGGGGRS